MEQVSSSVQRNSRWCPVGTYVSRSYLVTDKNTSLFHEENGKDNMKNKHTHEELLAWSQRAGPETYAAFSRHLKTGSPCITDVYFCVEVKKLGDRYGAEVIESAFKELQSNGGNPALKLVKKYASSTLARVSVYGPDYSADVHATCGITRGRDSFVSSDQ